MHWADALVKDLEGNQLVSTGISPSGPIHVGNMREILTGDMIYKAALKKGLNSRFIYLCDDIDPLRKVYPFLDQSYSTYVGYPLSSIPAPDGGPSYSEYFLKPFVDTLSKIDVNVEVIRTTELYREGKFERSIRIVVEKREKIKEILQALSGREIEENWFPYNPRCSRCGRINSTVVTSFDLPLIHYRCKCGNEGSSDIRKDEGKMPWRIEWPAKWFELGVTIEPFGKDHGASGGSYDTGKRIAEEVFGIKAPVPMIYERIFLKGVGVMHSSTGISIPASDMVNYAPPQILRFIIARSNPGRHINFDPGVGLLNLVDEFEKYQKAYNGQEEIRDEDYREVYEYSRIEGRESRSSISFRHLVTLVQIYTNTTDLLRILKKSGYEGDGLDDQITWEIEIARNWLSKYAPDMVKFRVMPEDYRVDLTSSEKDLLREFVQQAGNINWTPEDIHNTVHEILKERNVSPKEGFGSFYKVIIGKEQGPRLGYFLSNMDRNFVINRLKYNISS